MKYRNLYLLLDLILIRPCYGRHWAFKYLPLKLMDTGRTGRKAADRERRKRSPVQCLWTSCVSFGLRVSKKPLTLIPLFHLAVLTPDLPACPRLSGTGNFHDHTKKSLYGREAFCVKTLCAHCYYRVVYSHLVLTTGISCPLFI